MTEIKKTSLLRKILKWPLRIIGIVLLVLLIWSLIPIKQTIGPIQPRPDTQYWVLKEGYKIAYTRIEGDSANRQPTIIFLHGGPGGYIHSAIIRQMKEVARHGYDIYLYDQIGSGLSDRLPKPKDYSFERHLKDLYEIISTQIKQGRVILIGHSFGGILAAHFTAQYPEKVERMVLSSPGELQPYRTHADGTPVNLDNIYPTPSIYTFKQPIDVFKQTEKDFLQPRIVMSMLCAMLFNYKWASDREFDDYTNTMAAKFTKGMVADPENVQPEEGGAGGYSHGFSNYYGDLSDIREQLRTLAIPTLVLQGQYDQGAYSAAFEYADLLKGTYKFIGNAGHIIWWDQPAAYNKAIIDFLAEEK